MTVLAFDVEQGRLTGQDLYFSEFSNNICHEVTKMLRKAIAIYAFFAFASYLGAAQQAAPVQSKLTAAEIVDRNVAARGGLQAWRAVQTLSFSGKMAAGGNQRAALPVSVPGRSMGPQTVPVRPKDEVQLPFVMDLKRGGKMRLELQFNGDTAVQVYDGTNGWKLRPFLNRRVVEPFTQEEAKLASMKTDLDGPLVDYAAKGSKVELTGMEKVDGRDTYKVKLTTKNGISTDVWLDAQTFLETKMSGQPRRLDGIYHPVEIYFRDYRPVNGIQIPFVLETRILPASQGTQRSIGVPFPSEVTTIEKATVNPNFEEALFSKPGATTPIAKP
jgi:hypothetical protein